jgi:hypothetical protein
LYDGEVMPKGFKPGKIVKKVNNERGQMITVI